MATRNNRGRPLARGTSGSGYRGSNRGGNGRSNRGETRPNTEYRNTGGNGKQRSSAWIDDGRSNSVSRIARLVQEMVGSIKTLSDRVDALAGSAQPNALTNPEAAAARGKGPATKRGTGARGKMYVATNINVATDTIHNADFAQLPKTLYKLVQLRHHAASWKSLPQNVSNRLQGLLRDIKPPLADDDDLLRKDLDDLKDLVSLRLCEITTAHIERKLTEVTQRAGHLDPTELERARGIADKYARNRLGRRLPDQLRAEYLNDACDVVGALRPNEGTVPMEPEFTVVERKRKRRSVDLTDSPPPRSTLDPARDRPSTGAASSSEAPLEANPTAPPPSKRTVKPSSQSKPTASKLRNESGVLVYTCNNQDWEIEPTGKANVLVLADSNMRQLPRIPKDVEVHCLPGVDLRSTAAAVRRVQLDRQFTVVVQVGMNNRGHDSVSNERDLVDLYSALKESFWVKECVFLGLSIPKGLPPPYPANLLRINEQARELFGSEDWIAPLPSEAVQVRHSDSWGIHYAPDTLSEIVKRLEENLFETEEDFSQE